MNTYYVPKWMSVILRRLLKGRYVRRLTNFGKTERGTYKFEAPCRHCGDDEALTPTLLVWNKGVEEVRELLDKLFPEDIGELVHMAEEYARERAGRKEIYVYRCFVQLLLARAAELFSTAHPDRTLVVTGDFSVVGRFRAGARLRIIGKVEKV